MGYLDSPHVCPLPWTELIFGHHCMQVCCNAPQDVFFPFESMAGPWVDDHLDFWNHPGFIDLRRRMLEQGSDPPGQGPSERWEKPTTTTSASEGRAPPTLRLDHPPQASTARARGRAARAEPDSG